MLDLMWVFSSLCELLSHSSTYRVEQDFDNVVTRGHILKNKLKGTKKDPVLDFHDPKDTYPNTHNRGAIYS